MARLGTVRQVGRVLVCCGMAGRDMAGMENQKKGVTKWFMKKSIRGDMGKACLHR